MQNKLIYLLGVKHSGKSTTGRELAALMNLPFVDMDTEIEKMTGMPVRRLFVEQGAEIFKQAEAAVCEKISYECSQGVIATGGGICSNPHALAFLQKDVIRKKAHLVMLNLSEYEVCSRIIAVSKERGSYPAYIARGNPKNEEDVRRIFSSVYAERTSSYKEFCQIVIETDGKTPREISQEILEAIS